MTPPLPYSGAPRTLRLTLAAAAVSLALTGCTSSGYPADPDGTLDAITGATLRAGVSHHPPYVDARGAEPTGSEAELIRGFAAAHDAEVEWTVSSEESLMTALEKGDLDLVAGGLTTSSPWTSHAALTRGYTEVTGPDGEPVELAMAVPLGENQMLGALEAHLDQQGQQ